MDAGIRPEVVAPDRAAGGAIVVGTCAALALSSLVLPAALSFDPWAWLVWGREVSRLALDTTGGPSWKPLPVLFTTVSAPLGAVAVPLWTVVARTGALLALVGTYRLAARFGGVSAGAIAVALLMLTPDGDPRFLRLVGEGHVAPMSVAFLVFAVESHLDGRPSRALGLGWCVALLRPEAWPFLGLYGLWLWFRHPDHRRLVVAVFVSIPVLWFGGDWWGSGDPWHGADAAQVASSDSVAGRFSQAASVAASMVVIPAWAAAVVAVGSARRRGDDALRALATGAVAWTALVIVMATVLGYAALSRFYLPAAAVVCVLAGIGTARSLAALRHRGRGVVAVVIVVASVAMILPRATGVVPVLAEVAHRGRVESDLDRMIQRTGGSAALASCGEVAVEGTGLLRSAVAWKLDLPLRLVPRQLSGDSGVMLVRSGGKRDRVISGSTRSTLIERTTEWVAYAVRCPTALPRT